MAVGYDFLNARAKALKSRLVSSDRFRKWSHLGRVTAFAEALAATTPYGREIRQKDVSRIGPAELEAIFLGHLTEAFRSLWREAEPQVSRWLELWLAPWDLANIERILRGWRCGLSSEAIASTWVLAGTLSAEELDGLQAAGDVTALARRLAARRGLYQRWALALKRGGEQAPARLEEKLDAVWAGYAVSEAETNGENGATFAAFFSWEADTRNVMSALRLAHGGGGKEVAFLPGGHRLLRKLWEEMAIRQSLEGAFSLLEGTVFFEAVRREVPPFEPERALGRTEKRLRALTLQECGKLYLRASPLGIGVVLRYMQLEANEVENLRRIAYGLASGLPAGLIEEGLVFA